MWLVIWILVTFIMGTIIWFLDSHGLRKVLQMSDYDDEQSQFNIISYVVVLATGCLIVGAEYVIRVFFSPYLHLTRMRKLHWFIYIDNYNSWIPTPFRKYRHNSPSTWIRGPKLPTQSTLPSKRNIPRKHVFEAPGLVRPIVPRK